MDANVMHLERAKLNVDYPEFSLIFSWQSWDCFTDIDYDALEYLVKYSSRILLSNVRELSEVKMQLLKEYNGVLIIGIK